MAWMGHLRLMWLSTDVQKSILKSTNNEVRLVGTKRLLSNNVFR
jgi:hypothetical protein